MPTGIYERTKECNDAHKGIYSPMYGRRVGEEYGWKISKSLKGNKNPNYGGDVSGDYGLKISKTLSGRILPKNTIKKMKKPKSKKHIRNLKIAHNKPEVKEKHRQYQIKYLSTHDGYDHHHISKPAKILHEAIKKEYPDIKQEHPIGGFCVVDDYLPKYNLVIECYGNYPHANSKKYKADDRIYKKSAKEIWQRDKERIRRIKKLGYKVIIFWENEIYNNIERCIDLIKEVIK